MANPLVSAIIPNYNYSQYLRETIDSVLEQTYGQIEIIIVDDGSTDGSREILESYGDQISAIYQQNAGVSAARNNGVSRSGGDFLAFLDADDLWLPTKIEKQIARFTAEPSLGLVHVGVDEIDAEGNSLRKRLEGSNGDATIDLLAMSRKGVLGGGSGLMVPRNVFNEIGGFDTRLSTSADWDVFYQVASRYPVGFVPEILLNYRIHSANMHDNVKAMEHDIGIAFEKAIGNPSTPQARKHYGNLFKILAGSYFRSGNYSEFIRTAWQSIRYDPANLAYFIKYPLRKIRRKLGAQPNGVSRNSL